MKAMGRRVLIVEDSQYMRAILKSILSDAGFEIAGEAFNAEMALRLAEEVDPDVISLDILLPDNHDLDLLRKLKSRKPATAIVIVSAEKSAVIEQALQEGADACIVKPFTDELVSKAFQTLYD